MLHDRVADSCTTVLLAHGSGLPMDSPFMSDIATRLVLAGMSVMRFEFPYMAERRSGGSKRPPPRADKLCDAFCDAITEARTQLSDVERLVIGGKSLGGRVASMVAAMAHTDCKVQGLVCLGYPFHPPKKPESLRIDHLMDLACPTLICQGTRDPLGSRDEIATYNLPERLNIHWIEDGDHDFKPRKRSGRTQEQNCQDAADAIAAFAASLSNDA